MTNKNGVALPKYLGDIWYNTWWNNRVVSHVTKDMRHQDVDLERIRVDLSLGALRFPGGLRKRAYTNN